MPSISKIFRNPSTPLGYILSRYVSSTSGQGHGSGNDKKSGIHDDEYDLRTAFLCCSCPGNSKPSNPTLYDSRKFGHALPKDITPERFEALPYFPNGVFRWTAGEQLGPGAGKCCVYQCPEYFAYQHMTYYDMHLLLRCYRTPCPKSGRKPN